MHRPGARNYPGQSGAVCYAGNRRPSSARACPVLPQAQCNSNGARHKRRIGDRSKFDKPDAVLKVSMTLAATCRERLVLPIPPPPTSVSNLVFSRSSLDGRDVLFRPRKLVFRSGRLFGKHSGMQRRKILAQTGSDDLPQTFRIDQTFEPMLSISRREGLTKAGRAEARQSPSTAISVHHGQPT